MKILVDINHPAHAHFFKHFIWEMKKRGHKVLVTASHKDVAQELLHSYGLKFVDMGSYGKTIISKIINFPIMNWKMARLARRFNPDLFLGIASIRASYAARKLKKPCLIFDDTEHRAEINLYFKGATTLYNPICFKEKLGRKQQFYKGYHELAYLHPHYFKPDKKILNELGLAKDERFFIVRFVSWQAGHDIGGQGFTGDGKRKLIEILSKKGRVIITSEADLPPDLKKYQMRISPTKIHHLLYYADLYIGEGATMASEAAVLGTPAIFVSSLTFGTIEEQEKKYGLLLRFKSEKEAFDKIHRLLKDKDIKAKWQRKREKMLKDKIDMTKFMINAAKRYGN